MKIRKSVWMVVILVLGLVFGSETVLASEKTSDASTESDTAGEETMTLAEEIPETEIQLTDPEILLLQYAQAQVVVQGLPLEKYHVINVLGDSITEGVGASSEGKNYPTILAKLTGAKVNNYGLSCSRITDVDAQYSNVPSFIDRMYSMDKSADLIIVFGGTNDFWYGDCPIGSREDSSPKTFYGALNTMIRYFKGNFPNADIMFVTPYRQGKDADENHDCKRTTYGNYGTGTLQDYRKAILDRCEYYNIPVLDLYEDYELNTVDNREALVKYGQYLCDGVHLNDAGYNLLARKMYQFFMPDFTTYVPQYTEVQDMVFETAALPCMIQEGVFTMPNGSTISCKNGVTVSADLDLQSLYRYLVEAVFY